MEFKFLSAFFFILIIGMTSTFPAKEQTDVEIIPVDKKHKMHDFYDTFDYEDSWYPRIPSFALPDLGAIFKSLQDSLDSVFKSTNGTNTKGAGFPGLYFPDIDLDSNKTKKTSVTKTINGHKVEINETVYKDEDAHGGAFFKVSIINVLPDSKEVGQDTPKKDVEGVDENNANEIASNGEGSVYDDLNLYGHPENKLRIKRRSIDSIESIDNNDIDSELPKVGHDLTSDIRINTILKRSGAPKNPYAENIEDRIEKEIESIESFEDYRKSKKKKNWDDEIEDFDDIRPIKNDLSNDIHVNEILALRGARRNPDAEFFYPMRNTKSRSKYIDTRNKKSRGEYFNERINNQLPNVKIHKKKETYYY